MDGGYVRGGGGRGGEGGSVLIRKRLQRTSYEYGEYQCKVKIWDRLWVGANEFDIHKKCFYQGLRSRQRACE